MSTLSDRIAWILSTFKISQSELARIAGVKQPSVHAWASGATKRINTDAALLICRRFPISQTWLTNGIGEPQPKGASVVAVFPEEETPPPGLVFIKAYRVECAAGDGRYECELDETVEGKSYRASWLQKRGLKASKLKVFKVVGDSMSSLICDGDSITVNTAETTITPGKVYAFCFEGGFRVKRLRPLMNGGLSVISDNPDWERETIPPEKMEYVHIIGRVVDRSGSGGL